MFEEKKVLDILQKPPATTKQINQIMAKAAERNGLDLDEVGALLQVKDQVLIDEIFKVAAQIKNDIYGNRLVLFAPLYASSYCVNDCEYCAFHCRNKAPRKKLSMDEVKEQVEILEDMGHKRLLLEFGEDPVNSPIDYVVEVIKNIYAVKKGQGAIRRVNINVAATSVEDYRKLHEVGIGTYQLFQETYHPATYQKLHRGPKADYQRQLTALDRAFQGGIDDVGIGVLFGLYDYRYEVLSLVAHAQYLESEYGVGPHTISVPRFQAADTVGYQPEHEVADKDFLKLIAILRLAVPYTGMIMSTRESPEMRRQAFEVGISQTSAGSKTTPGGYGDDSGSQITSQFSLHDHRSLDEVIHDVCQLGYLHSFCTACYRVGRTGEEFMKYAKAGTINEFCTPNAIMTFMEYLEDYASAKTKKAGLAAVEKSYQYINNEAVLVKLKGRVEEIKEGKRDIYF